MQGSIKYYKTLELNKVLELLAGEAALDDAADLAKNLMPSSDINTVKTLIGYTNDAFNLSANTSFPSFGKAKNVCSYLEKCNAGGALNLKEFLELGETLRVIRSIIEWKNNNKNQSANSLSVFFNQLVANNYLEDKIKHTIISEDEISDNASPDLCDIRRKISKASSEIRNKLDRIVKNPSKNKYLQESIVTVRDGRFVVPVKQEYRSEVSGIVHDTSSSGATLFIEPIEVVEINNDIRVLKGKEKDEILKILLELSGEVANFSETIKTSYNALVQLSLIFAKASLAYKMKASLPNINQNGYVYLKNARHPLIDKNKVVPITVELGKEYRTLVITGPNTGGKTVALKTVGLLTLMVMCGMLIPVSEDSHISVFDNILVDIGDEQSIEQSLSTFSSHIINIIEILKQTNDKSLVLLDELGGGTDPQEGAALAQAIILYIHNRYAKIVTTTHYSQLKSFALSEDGVQNASFEFNVETLKPTYNLLIGVPGRSNAFAIADSLGMEKSVLKTALEYVSEDDRQFDKVIANLEESLQKLNKDNAEVSALKSELLKQKEILNSKLDAVNKECDKLLENAKHKAQDMLDTTRYKSDILLNSLETAAKELTKQNNAELLLAAKSNAKQTISALEDGIDPIVNQDNESYVLPRQLFVGDKIKINSLGQNGVVEQISGNKITVMLGNLKTAVDIKDIRLITEKAEKIKPKTRNVKSKTEIVSKNALMELDIRGYNCEEGLLEVERYIDNSVMTGIHTVGIIHGKGTGVLRSAVHSFLKRHPQVKSYRLGVFGEGENGITIVELK